MINLYHRGFLPEKINASKLHRWPFIYLHGDAEAPEFKEDAPDIFLADLPLDQIDDGVIECQLHINTSIKKLEGYIWSHADEIKFCKGQYIVSHGRRHGLIISTENMKDWIYAYEHWTKRSICI